MIAEIAPRLPRARHLSRLARDSRVRSMACALVDQGLVSGGNFAVLVLLGRTSTPSEFGAFVLAYTALLFAGSWQAALITQPHNTIGATASTADYARYTTSAAALQLALGIAAAILTLLGAALAYTLGNPIAPLLALMAPTIAFWQLQEFARRVLYTEGRPLSALLNDLCSYGGQILGIGALWLAGTLDARSAIAIIALTSLIGALLGARQLRSSLAIRPAIADMHAARRQNWRFGRWLLATFLLSWTSDAIYPVVVGVLIGTAATGTVRAVETLFAPVQILSIALTSVLVPRAARVAADGSSDLRAFILRTLRISAPPVVAFCLLVTLLWRPLLHAVFDTQFAATGWIVAVMAFNAIANYLRFVVGIALRAVGATAPLFHAGLWLAGITVCIGLPTIYLHGLRGFAIAMVIGGGANAVAHWRAYHLALRRPPNAGTARLTTTASARSVAP